MEPRAARLVVIAVAAVVAVCAVLVTVSVVTGSSRADQPGTTSGTGQTTGEGQTTGGSTDPNAPVVAFYGDSYTLGTGASDPAKRWSSVIAADRGWNEFNYSVNGLGFVNHRQSTPPDYGPEDGVSRSIAADPDILFITMGLNDNFSMPDRADDIRSAIATDFQTLRTALPDARIVVVEPFWYTDDRPDSLAQIIDWVQSEATVIGADFIPGASHWIEGHPEWMASDGLHPNDDGYAEMAVRMDESLRAIGL
ncbi:SGNH/GDSL hydrolase family protein [Herbiconiux sp. VKM Ac-1786]|uniref:SGNH/GDSL hydrolase family protein n=1 Tax=Herbiconiux sp. VKM Ac-1786 TaxID=2783824 RepID=UPI00188B59D8|nr:SGNH/GDSL hydrolase family protein [Herbiconiux sp. VKM Ac-1786]MBF4572874.1 SGNH/GDSL hydrolase family protein [Herbiconiux sp. VKM Ac-1786]